MHWTVLMEKVTCSCVKYFLHNIQKFENFQKSYSYLSNRHTIRKLTFWEIKILLKGHQEGRLAITCFLDYFGNFVGSHWLRFSFPDFFNSFMDFPNQKKSLSVPLIYNFKSFKLQVFVLASSPGFSCNDLSVLNFTIATLALIGSRSKILLNSRAQ